jgi:hypothetical protein
MTVRINKSELSLREQLNSVNDKIGTEGIANGAVTRDKINWWENSLAPYFERVAYSGGADPSYDMVGNGGSTIFSSQGNNGPSIKGRLRGSARGKFLVDWTPGYSWGWSTIIITSLDNWNEESCSYVSSSPAGKPWLWMANNNSNNVRMAQYWDGYKQINPYSITGLSNTRNSVWREADDTIKVFTGSSTVTIGKIAGDLVVYGGDQSPFSITINAAANII